MAHDPHDLGVLQEGEQAMTATHQHALRRTRATRLERHLDERFRFWQKIAILAWLLILLGVALSALRDTRTQGLALYGLGLGLQITSLLAAGRTPQAE
jgi:hypothetical protein